MLGVCQRLGSNSLIRLFGQVDNVFMTSHRLAYGAYPLILADWIKFMMVTESPDGEPAKSQFLRLGLPT